MAYNIVPHQYTSSFSEATKRRAFDKLYVVTAVSNPCRYRTRYELYQKFAQHCADSGAVLYTVEMAFGQRPFAVTEEGNPQHIRVRGSHEMWHKENLLNIGVSRLPNDWRYVAWVDADVLFARQDWVEETIHQLQHFRIVQMFTEAIDTDITGLPYAHYRGFGWSHVHGVPRIVPNSKEEMMRLSQSGMAHYTGEGTYYGPCEPQPSPQQPSHIKYWHHPGFAWATRRDIWDAVGGLIDWAVVGESDYLMARGLVGEMESALYPKLAEGYRTLNLEWQEKTLKHIRKDIGYIDGLLIHGWHGKKALRQYWDRCRILVETKYDPHYHIKKDWQGLYQLHDRGDDASILLRDKVRMYFRARDEDGTSL